MILDHKHIIHIKNKYHVKFLLKNLGFVCPNRLCYYFIFSQDLNELTSIRFETALLLNEIYEL